MNAPPTKLELMLGKPRHMSMRYPRFMVGQPLYLYTSAMAALGDFLFGYSQGAIASVAVQPSFIKTIWGPTVTLDDIANVDTGVNEWVQAITTSCLNITAFIFSLIAAHICDFYGRRHSVRFGAVCYLGASIGQALSRDLTSFIASRCLQGVGLGFLSMTVPVIQTEIAKDHSRGQLISIEYICLNMGYLMSALAGWRLFYAIPHGDISWRGIYVIQGAFACFLIAATWIMPETPRWLVKNGFEAEAISVLADMHSAGDLDDPSVKKSFERIRTTLQMEADEGQASWWQLITRYPRQTLMAITGQVFAQFNGINAVLYYLPEDLLRAGFTVPKSLLFAFVAAICYVAGTIPTLFTVEHGRRRLLLWTSWGLMGSLVIVGGLQLASRNASGAASQRLAYGTFSFFCVYLFTYGWGWGPVPWLLPAEVFPMRARARGAAAATAINWLANFIIAFFTPALLSTLQGGFYLLLAGFVLISYLTVLFFYRETAGKSLEELQQVFESNSKKLGGGDDVEHAFGSEKKNHDVSAGHVHTPHDNSSPITDGGTKRNASAHIDETSITIADAQSSMNGTTGKNDGDLIVNPTDHMEQSRKRAEQEIRQMEDNGTLARTEDLIKDAKRERESRGSTGSSTKRLLDGFRHGRGSHGHRESMASATSSSNGVRSEEYQTAHQGLSESAISLGTEASTSKRVARSDA